MFLVFLSRGVPISVSGPGGHLCCHPVVSAIRHRLGAEWRPPVLFQTFLTKAFRVLTEAHESAAWLPLLC